MTVTVYVISAVLVFVFSGLLAMAGLGAAFLFVPLFYYLGVPLSEAMPTALLLNVVSLLIATINYWRSGLVNWRVGLPVLIMAVVLAPIGARTTALVNRSLLLWMFAAFLFFAGGMMLFYNNRKSSHQISRKIEVFAGMGAGSIAGFLGGLLGVGGGNFVLPVLNWIGMEPKIAAATTALVVVFSSLSGFLGHIAMSSLSLLFLVVMAVMAASGSIVGSYLMKNKVSNQQLKKLIGILLWAIAVKMVFDLIG